jgi:CheY-like chemotaxis protein
MDVMPHSLESNKPISILLVDDHRSLLWGLERLIEGEKPRMQVIGKASNKMEVFAFLTTEKPDVILLDLDLNGESSLDFLEELLQKTLARVLVLTAEQDPAIHQRAILNGASGVVLKNKDTEEICINSNIELIKFEDGWKHILYNKVFRKAFYNYRKFWQIKKLILYYYVLNGSFFIFSFFH